MKKSLIFWFAAVTCAAWILVGCEQEAKTEYVTQKEMIHLDVATGDVDVLAGYLATPGDLSIGLTEEVDLKAALTVPDGKVVYILPDAGLDVKTYDLTVDGIVYVGGTLTAESTGVVKIPNNGHVGVVKGGALSVETAASVNDGATPTPVTVLGSSKVGFASEITLTLAATGTTALDITTALGYFSNGTLDASASTVVGALLPSAAAAAFTPLVSAAKNLVITADGAETGSSLTVPAGLALTTSDDLDTVTTLTVNGTLNSAGTFDALATVTGTGSVTAAVVDAGTAKYLIESSLAQATLASTTITDDDLVIPANTTREFTGAAAPSGDVTVNGAVTVLTGASLTILAGKTLDIAGTVALTGTGSLVLATTSTSNVGKITGAGTLTAGATTITGAWEAVGTSTSGGTVTIASASPATATITADGTKATGLKASAAGATITQLAGSGNKLTIATDTTIDLGGTATAVGSLVLTGDGTNPGEIELTHASSSIVKTSNTVGGSAFGSATTIGGKTFAQGGSGKAEIYTTGNNAAGKIAQILGGTGTYGLKAGNAANNVTIDGAQDVAS